MLQHIIVATAALHMVNAARNNEPSKPADGDTIFATSCPSRSRVYHDALEAKQRALEMLSAALMGGSTADRDIILACIMLFIMFELLDSGVNDWRFHMDGARQLMGYLHDNALSANSTLRDIRSVLTANCMVYVLTCLMFVLC